MFLLMFSNIISKFDSCFDIHIRMEKNVIFGTVQKNVHYPKMSPFLRIFG